MTKEIDWQKVASRWGDGTFGSNRQIAREFGITEAAIRKKSRADCWARDTVRERINYLRAQVNVAIDLLEESVRARLAETSAPLQDKPGYPDGVD